MAASRTAGATVPEELQRQSDRITEQLTQLNIILDTVTDRLGQMSTMMANYDPELVTQINNLKSSLETYKGKAADIYGDVSYSLARYAANLLQNLEALTGNVTEIGNIVEGL